MKDPAPSLTVRRGGTITLRGLAQGYASPSSTAPKVVEVVAASGTSAKLRALSSGNATVTLATPYCLGAPRSDSLGDHFNQRCPALEVTVTD